MCRHSGWIDGCDLRRLPGAGQSRSRSRSDRFRWACLGDVIVCPLLARLKPGIAIAVRDCCSRIGSTPRRGSCAATSALEAVSSKTAANWSYRRPSRSMTRRPTPDLRRVPRRPASGWADSVQQMLSPRLQPRPPALPAPGGPKAVSAPLASYRRRCSRHRWPRPRRGVSFRTNPSSGRRVSIHRRDRVDRAARLSNVIVASQPAAIRPRRGRLGPEHPPRARSSAGAGRAGLPDSRAVVLYPRGPGAA